LGIGRENDVAEEELAGAWFRIRDLEPGVRAIEEPLHDEQVASFLIEGRERALLIDAGGGIGDLLAVVRSLTALPVTLLLSHSHWDHVGSAWQFAGISDILVHPLESERLRAGVDHAQMREYCALERMRGPFPPGVDAGSLVIAGVEPTAVIGDGDRIDLGGRVLEVIHVPGHSPGLLALLDRTSGALFTTDAVYGGALYAHLPGVDLGAYLETTRRLAELEPDVRNVYPSHNERRLDPEILGRVDRAFREVTAGRPPDERAGGVDRHLFDGFSILLPAGDAV
jgi:glyoxylase-like metal-dependent hydrolase (beta-lactamase superfamily II)